MQGRQPRSLSSVALLAARVAVVCVVLPACGARGGAAAHAVTDHPLLGASAPQFELPRADGKGSVSLAEAAGKIVIVDFWATWCEPCRASFPAYQALVDEFRGDLVVLGVSVDEEPWGIAEFVSVTKVRFPIAWDEGQTAAQSYRPPNMPTSFVVDRSGIVRFVHGGFSAGDERALRLEVQSLR